MDAGTATGAEIDVEQRHPDELRLSRVAGERPNWRSGVQSGIFDVTLGALLISAIVTDTGVHRPPYDFLPMRHVLAIDAGTTGVTCA